MNAETLKLSPTVSAALGASEISVSEEGDIILSLLAGGAVAVGRIMPQGVDYLDVGGQPPDPEFQRAIEMALVPYALDYVDWEQVHTLWALRPGHIWLWPDGSVVHLDSGTIPGRDWGGIAALECDGPGQIDGSYYAEGWTTFDEETREYITDDGRRLSFEDMVRESIRECDWSDLYDQFRERFMKSAERL